MQSTDLNGYISDDICKHHTIHIAIISSDISSDDDTRNFFAESCIMTKFQHPNVLGLLGVCFDSPDGIPLLVLPFMVNGNLKTYLVKFRRCPTSDNPDIFPEVLFVMSKKISCRSKLRLKIFFNCLTVTIDFKSHIINL